MRPARNRHSGKSYALFMCTNHRHSLGHQRACVRIRQAFISTVGRTSVNRAPARVLLVRCAGRWQVIMRLKRAILLAVPIVLIAGALVAWRMAAPGFGAKAADKPAPPAILVTSTTATIRDMPVFVQGLGTVQAFNTVSIKSRVDGQITQVFFREVQE